MRARSARYTIRSTKYIHNLITVNPADYINKHTTTLYLSFLSISTHTHTHTHTFSFYFVRLSRRRLDLLKAFEFRAVFCLQPNIHQSYGVLDGNHRPDPCDNGCRIATRTTSSRLADGRQNRVSEEEA